MKIAITGARGSVGQACVKLCAAEGHHTIQINRTEEKDDGKTPNTEMRTANSADDYDATVEALKGADAVIHLAAIPNPVGKADATVHNNNVCCAFIGMRAAAANGIKRFALASSVNAIGLAYANQPLNFPYFPIDEDYKPDPTDAYALAKQEAETQAAAFVRWFPGMRVASLRIHQVEPLKDVRDEHEREPKSGITQLWGWVSPHETAKACLLACTTDKFEGHEVFNIVAPTTTQDTPSKDLAAKYYPNAEIRDGLEDNKGFWTTSKAKKLLGWVHEDKE